jgi:hypothetical protein
MLYLNQKFNNQQRRNTMKKVLSTIVAALVALSFAGVVCAADPAPAAMPAGHPAVAAPAADTAKEAKPAKKAKKKTKKAKKPAAEPATPSTPATPAAK